MTDHILYEADEGIGIITLNQPASRNALTQEMIEGLTHYLEQASRDVEISCLILQGSGGAFCAGGNIKDMQERTGYASGGPVHAWRSMLDQFQRVPQAFAKLDVPIIAAVEGPAMGAGCDIAAMCDIRIAADNAIFGETFIKLGVVSGDGGSWFLARVIGYARAAEMAFTGDPIDAETAVRWGLVSRVVSVADLPNEARALAARIAKNPPNSLRLAKRLLRHALESELAASLDLAAAMQGVALHTEDQQEAVRAMLERRPASYRGV